MTQPMHLSLAQIRSIVLSDYGALPNKDPEHGKHLDVCSICLKKVEKAEKLRSKHLSGFVIRRIAEKVRTKGYQALGSPATHAQSCESCNKQIMAAI